MMIIKQSSGILVLHSDNESNAKKIHHSQPTELTVYFNMIIIWFPLTLNHEYYKMLLRLRNLFLRKKGKRFDPMQYVALKKLFWLHIMSTRVWIYSWCCLQLLNERKKKNLWCQNTWSFGIINSTSIQWNVSMTTVKCYYASGHNLHVFYCDSL